MPLYTWSTKDKPQILPSAHFAGTAYQALDSWNLQTAPAPSVQPLPQPALRKRQQRPGENIVLMIYYNTLFQIQKEGWESAASWGRVPRGKLAPWSLGKGPATSLILDFPENNRRGPGAFWVIPVPGSDQVWGVREQERLRRTLYPPHLGQ